MEKKIKIKDEEITIRFNYAVECTYEEIANIPFSLDDLRFKRYLICLYAAAIIVNNKDTTITLEWIMTEASSEEIRLIDDAIAECMTDFLHLPKVIPADDKPADEEGEQPKN